MGHHTDVIRVEVDAFFKAADEGIEEQLQTREYEKHAAFLNHYTQHFPTMGDYVYQHIFDSTDLKKHYADFTLQNPLEAGDPEVERKRRNYRKEKPFYIYYYHKYILEKTETMKALGEEADLKRFLDHWQDKLDVQGFVFQRSTKESYTARNIAFHLAFALGLSMKKLKTLLLKCLLQQVYNPKNPKECIFWYCLKNGISYEDMRREYLEYYRSGDFDEKYRETVETGIVSTETWELETDIRKVMQKEKEDFLRYLWRLKYTENQFAEMQKTKSGEALIQRTKRRTTPGQVYWENITHFVDVEDPTTLTAPLTTEEYCIRFPVIWNALRKKCYEANRDALMDRNVLKALFAGVDYSKRGIENRKWGQVDMPRTEIIATQFIACCARNPAGKLSPSAMRKDFQKEVKVDLESSGLRKFYLRSPFELFITLCFLHDDPFGYFMASWEAAET